MIGNGVVVAGHRVHTMLVVFPLGLFAGAVIFDIVHLSTGDAAWGGMSFWLLAAGIIGALVAAVFGLLDWLGVPAGTRAKRVGVVHGIGNVLVALLFAMSWLLRREAPGEPSGVAIGLGFIAFALILVTGWLGAELVNRMGIGVYPDANPNAPSSLSTEPAVERPTDRPVSTDQPASARA